MENTILDSLFKGNLKAFQEDVRASILSKIYARLDTARTKIANFVFNEETESADAEFKSTINHSDKNGYPEEKDDNDKDDQCGGEFLVNLKFTVGNGTELTNFRVIGNSKADVEARLNNMFGKDKFVINGIKLSEEVITEATARSLEKSKYASAHNGGVHYSKIGNKDTEWNYVGKDKSGKNVVIDNRDDAHSILHKGKLLSLYKENEKLGKGDASNGDLDHLFGKPKKVSEEKLVEAKSPGEKYWAKKVKAVAKAAEKPNIRLVQTHVDGDKTAKVYKNNDHGEYQVKFHSGGTYHKDNDYFSDDKDDAHATAKSWIKAKNEEVVSEANVDKNKYQIYHDSYTSAIQEVGEHAKRHGYTHDPEEMADKVGLGPVKPKAGVTNRFSVKLHKDGKEQKRMHHFQVYGRGDGKYELNQYMDTKGREKTNEEVESPLPYHKSFSDALEEAKKFALASGYTHNPEEFNTITNKGFIKPSESTTNAFHCSLHDAKSGKELKAIHNFQITGKDGKFSISQDIK